MLASAVPIETNRKISNRYLRLAIIDLGTNSVRFDVYETDFVQTHRRIYREKRMIRLGDSLFQTHRLDPKATRRALEAFRLISDKIDRFGVNRTVAFATAAMREAKNSVEFRKKIYKETGIRLKVISGSEEAKLIAKGIVSNEETPSGMYVLVDIGGGSTELSVCRKKSVLDSCSFDLGANRLQQIYLKKSPPSFSAMKELRSHIKKSIGASLVKRNWVSVPTVLGSSGTIRALRKIFKAQGEETSPFKKRSLEEFIENTKSFNMNQLKAIPGMEPRRVDLILSGAILLDEICNVIGIKKIYTTNFNLRDGILEKELEKLISFRLSGKT